MGSAGPWQEWRNKAIAPHGSAFGQSSAYGSREPAHTFPVGPGARLARPGRQPIRQRL